MANERDFIWQQQGASSFVKIKMDWARFGKIHFSFVQHSGKPACKQAASIEAALKVDGGACANNYLMQTMADISSLPVKRPCCVETTALGAAYLAGLAVGYWKSTEDVLQNWAVDRKFTPAITEAERAERLKGWNKAVRCSYGWAKE
mgnify:CR=1 FL=1